MPVQASDTVRCWPAACLFTSHCAPSSTPNRHRDLSHLSSLQADVAHYYSVEVDYYSGKRDAATLQLDLEAIADCATTAKDALQSAVKSVADGTTLVVRCPEQACTSGAVYTSKANVYLFTSSICTAAVHAGVTGRRVMLTLSPGVALADRQWSGAWPIVKCPAGFAAVGVSAQPAGPHMSLCMSCSKANPFDSMQIWPRRLPDTLARLQIGLMHTLLGLPILYSCRQRWRHSCRPGRRR